MSYDRLLPLADAAFGVPELGDFHLELLVAMVPALCDGCAIELFGRDLPPEDAAIWSPFRKILQGPEPVTFGLASASSSGGPTGPGGEDGISGDDALVLERIGIRSAIGVPLRLEARLVGSLSVFMASSGRSFSESDFSGVRQVAERLEDSLTEDWLGGTQPIKIARGEEIGLLVRKHSFGRLERYVAEREAAERRRQQAAVADLASQAIVEPELGRILRVGAHCVADVLRLDYVKVLELLPEEQTFVMRAAAGFPEEFMDSFRVPLRGESQAGFTLQLDETMRSPDFEQETRFETPDIEDFGLRSGMSVVIGGAEAPWGVLEADTTEPRDYTEGEAAFMKTVADILGQAIARSASDARLRYQATLLETVAEAVAALDPEGRIVYWNRQARRLFGWTAEELRNRSPLEVLAAPSEQERFEEIREGILAGGDWAGAVRVVAKDGTELTVHLTAAPVTRNEHETIGTVITALDITDRLELEERLRHAQKMEGMGRLAGGVAHDFNNLLTTITGFTDLLLDEPACREGSARDFVEEIRRASSRAMGLTSQLLAFSRRQALLPQVCDPRKLLRRMETLLRQLAGEHVELVIRTDESTGRILADPIQIEQVVMNLVTNARDAMPDGGRLTLTVESRKLEQPTTVGETQLTPGRYVVLVVEDTGSGIAPEVQPRVFDPFFTTKPRGKGTGLGLSSVYGIMQQSGGAIALDSEPGKGTTFSVFLPELERPAAAQGRGEKDESGNTPRKPPTEGKTVLVVEDEVSVRALLARLLPRMGYGVIEATDGAEALEICRERAGEIDMVLTDVVMPVMGGSQLAAALDREQPGLPVLFMSGYTGDDLAGHDILEQGAPLLQKPFTIQQLGSFLGRASNPDPNGESEG